MIDQEWSLLEVQVVAICSESRLLHDYEQSLNHLFTEVKAISVTMHSGEIIGVL